MSIKKVCIFFLILLTEATQLSGADPIDKVVNLIRQGNVHELSGLFDDNVDISILGTADTYTKVEAELILDKFFSQNKLRAVKMLHNVNSNPSYRFGVLIINTNNGPFRITFTLKGNSESMKLISFRIETERVR